MSNDCGECSPHCCFVAPNAVKFISQDNLSSLSPTIVVKIIEVFCFPELKLRNELIIVFTFCAALCLKYGRHVVAEIPICKMKQICD